MPQIKIISNPYKQEIEYKIYQESSKDWIDVGVYDPNGKLREENIRRCFLPFNVKEILDIIVAEYYLEKKGPVKVVFEGTKDEYEEILKVSKDKELENKVEVLLSDSYLDDGKEILIDTKDIFYNIKPVIEDIAEDDDDIIKKLAKVSDALDDIVPICVFGNYSAGKSTFINSLIGREVLPSGGDPVTAKAFKIQNIKHEDETCIKFKHWDNDIELAVNSDGVEIIKGDSSDEMLIELNKEINNAEVDNMYKVVNISLDFINAYEKKDSSSTEIGNMIELYIPFSKTGVLGHSKNKFVIFDTPGSNTASNDGHIEVLKEALEGFSNGIPVWVSQYEAIDTMDNEKLCNDILSIDALDQRFTMIVLNKADVSDLPEKGFSDKQIKDIKEYSSVEKMYSSGIFFVSSIMGLGAKNDGKLSDKYYRKIYKLQNDSFSDPDDEDYMSLYQYNIMPLQIKRDVIAYSVNEDNLVYVNSGLHCVESEIEEFASKYSTYNKCQMVNALLNDVVEKTTVKIEKKVEQRKNRRQDYENELDDKKKELNNSMEAKSEELETRFKEGSYEAINVYSKKNLDYDYTLDRITKLNEKYIKENKEEYNMAEKKKNVDEAISKMQKDLKGHFKEFSIKDIKGSVSAIAKDTKKGVGNIYDNKKELAQTEKDAYKETVDEVLNEVIEEYKNSMDDAIKQINHFACNYWENNSQLLKEELIKIVTASDALTESQKKLLSDLIFNYKNITFDDKADSIFVKPKYLYGHLGKLDLFRLEKLNVNKLYREYNKTIAKNIETISTDMDENYYISFQKWQSELSMMIKNNIVEFNSKLQAITEDIEEETKKINKLETSQQKIKKSLAEIEELVAFKSKE